ISSDSWETSPTSSPSSCYCSKSGSPARVPEFQGRARSCLLWCSLPDIWTSSPTTSHSTTRVVYIACSFTTVWLIYSKFKATYDGNHDTFRVEFLVVPTAILAFLVNHDFTPLEILWTFSIYLESVAILPQLFMVSKTGEAETITSHYLFALGVYRTLYLFNWIWRYHFEGFFDLIAIVAGLVQTVLYCDFFYLYITKVLKGKKLSLPA
uniref:ER lumen protein-retaining receptor n=1 Tax=Macaca fascicularis TaxID=9541 RepID=A0A2K5UAM1_MACFA